MRGPVQGQQGVCDWNQRHIGCAHLCQPPNLAPFPGEPPRTRTSSPSWNSPWRTGSKIPRAHHETSSCSLTCASLLCELRLLRQHQGCPPSPPPPPPPPPLSAVSFLLELLLTLSSPPPCPAHPLVLLYFVCCFRDWPPGERLQLIAKARVAGEDSRDPRREEAPGPRELQPHKEVPGSCFFFCLRTPRT